MDGGSTWSCWSFGCSLTEKGGFGGRTCTFWNNVHGRAITGSSPRTFDTVACVLEKARTGATGKTAGKFRGPDLFPSGFEARPLDYLVMSLAVLCLMT